jgi:2-polyprenyl-6-methoxyphenol hydroxylase-like FAD-dependent oxidoreductase
MSAFDVTPLQDEALNEEVIVLGAGASGLAAAVLLARQGMKVTIYERMQDLDQADEESYPIGVNPRGLEVLRRVDPVSIPRSRRPSM